MLNDADRSGAVPPALPIITNHAERVDAGLAKITDAIELLDHLLDTMVVQSTDERPATDIRALRIAIAAATREAHDGLRMVKARA